MTQVPEAALILNPTAGRGRAGREAAAIREMLGPQAAEWPWLHTKGRGDAEELARRAAESGIPLVVAVGGDGTLHEVMNGILGSPATLGLIPFGTGNDLARTLGLYGNLETACRTVVSGETRRIDVGVIDGQGTGGPRHFLVLSGAGFDARTARTVNEGVKYLSGAAAYVWGAILTLRDFQPFELTLTIDDAPPRRQRAMFVSFANAETTGGGMKIAPGAQVDDGFLDICLVGEVGKATLLYQLSQVFSGAHVRHPAVSLLRCRTVQVEADPPQPLLIDGEVCGTTPAAIRLLPGALPMKVPAA